jgi:hypothetical protein
MGLLDIINKSPYRIIFYICIPYFIFIIIFKLCIKPKDNEHFVDMHKPNIPPPSNNPIILKPTHQQNDNSPKEKNYARNMAEQDRIKKQIGEIDKQRKQKFLTEYREASKIDLELGNLKKEITELKEKLSKCTESSELNKEKSVSDDNTSISSKKESSETIVGCKNDSECNIFYGDGKNTCKSNKQCRCEVGSGILCQYGPTHYKDTKDMTKKEKTIFKNLSNYDNFTIQDYKNWLGLYKKDYYLLSDEHLINLRKSLRGEPIALRDIPTGGLRPPLTSQKYFAEMYDKLGDLEQIVSPINSSTTGNQVGYNYADYSDFSPPTSIPQLRVINGEIERKYRRPSAINKIFPVPLEDAIGPYVSNPAM